VTIAILIFSEPKDEQPSSSQRLRDAASALGHEAVVLYEPFLSFHSDGAGSLEVRHEGRTLPHIDVIVARPNYIEEPGLHSSTVTLLTRAGYRMVNGNAAGVALSKNKLEQHTVFAEAGVAMPSWVMARGARQIEVAAEQLGYPVVLKVAFGTHGKGVFFATSPETLAPIADYLDVRDSCPLIVERFVAEANTTDVRVFVVGQTVVAAMERVARTGDIRANAAQGGEGHSVILTDAERDLALRAAAVARLDIAGVDILRSRTGPLVIEINANPGFAELERVTGVDIAKAIIEFSCSTLK
jgi:ribosomal protein S6--L-glutamate ligase